MLLLVLEGILWSGKCGLSSKIELRPSPQHQPCLALAVKCASVIAFTLQQKAVLKPFSSLNVRMCVCGCSLSK